MQFWFSWPDLCGNTHTFSVSTALSIRLGVAVVLLNGLVMYSDAAYLINFNYSWQFLCFLSFFSVLCVFVDIWWIYSRTFNEIHFINSICFDYWQNNLVQQQHTHTRTRTGECTVSAQGRAHFISN